MTDHKPVVLFLCTGNSCRSQMAEAFARRYAGDRLEVHSAGLVPAGIHPMTIQVMEEAGVSMDGHRSKSVDDFLGRLVPHYLFIVCDHAAGNCPTVWPGGPAMERIVHTFPDPVTAVGSDQQKLQAFRDVRDQIDQAVRQWTDTLR
ncbi:MAG: arsenate reductase ArsC [Phycisphaerae bacterium]